MVPLNTVEDLISVACALTLMVVMIVMVYRKSFERVGLAWFAVVFIVWAAADFATFVSRPNPVVALLVLLFLGAAFAFLMEAARREDVELAEASIRALDPDFPEKVDANARALMGIVDRT